MGEDGGCRRGVGITCNNQIFAEKKISIYRHRHRQGTSHATDQYHNLQKGEEFDKQHEEDGEDGEDEEDEDGEDEEDEDEGDEEEDEGPGARPSRARRA